MSWNFDTDRPIYIQIVEKIKLKIISQEYTCGSQLPSVRELATIAGVNPNTMQKALTQLESEGIVYSLRTSGRFVTDDREVIRVMREEEAHIIIHECHHKLSLLGLTSLEMIEKFGEEVRTNEPN